MECQLFAFFHISQFVNLIKLFGNFFKEAIFKYMAYSSESPTQEELKGVLECLDGDVDALLDDQLKSGSLINFQKDGISFNITVNPNSLIQKKPEEKSKTAPVSKPFHKIATLNEVIEHNKNEIENAKMEIENAKAACSAIYDIIYEMEKDKKPDLFKTPKEFSEELNDPDIENAIGTVIRASLDNEND